jgi:glycosyltransferase involved in cell wall biosynthesis
MLKIGLDAREFQKGNLVTGIGRYLLNFLEFVTVNKPDYEFVLFCNQHTEVDLESPNLKKIMIPEFLTFWWDQVQLPLSLRREKIDVFLTPYFKAPLFSPGRLVVIIHDLIPLLYEAYRNPGRIPNRIYFKNLAGMAVRNADRIITISQHSKKDIMKVFGVPEEKIAVITLAADRVFRQIDYGLSDVLSKYQIDGNFIFYFGNFKPHKNVRALIEAYHKFPDQIKEEYRLVLGGKKDRCAQALIELSQNLGLEDRVLFTDFVPKEDLPYLYNAAEVFVFPSLYEGFGLPPLEAMACGTPVIAFKIASLPEVIGDAGILLDPCGPDELAETIVGLLADNVLKRFRAKQFSIEKMSGELLASLQRK